MESTMSGAMLWVAAIGACVAMSLSPLPSSDMVDPESTRARSTRRAEVRLAATVAAFSICAVVALLALGRGATWPVRPLTLGLALGLVLIHPWVIVRWVCIPLGLARTAWWLSRLGGHPWVRDPEGGALLSGALAALRHRKHDPRVAEFLTLRLRRDRLRGAGVVAAALLAADAGDRTRARSLMQSLELFDPDLCPPLSRRIAQDWLLADDAGSGQWTRIAETADDLPNVSRTARFFAAAARRLVGDSRTPAATLVRRWLVAPRRLQTASLLGRALRSRPRDRSTPVLPRLDARYTEVLAANDGGASHLEPISLLAEAAREPDRTERAAPRLRRLAAAWDQALSGFELRRRLRERTNALEGAATGEAATIRLQSDVATKLAELLRTGHVGDMGLQAPPRSTLGRAREALFEELFDELCLACAEASVRRDPLNVPAPILEWEACLHVMERYEQVFRIANAPERRQAYALVELELRQTAAWMWNDLRERGLANAISAWLLLEAERVEDHTSAAYHRHNAALVV
jgi:hypothetical protein